MRIDDLIKIGEKYKLTSKQVVYMYCLQNDLEPYEQLEDLEIGELRLKGFLKDNNPTDFWYGVVKNRLLQPINFKFNSQLEPIINYILNTVTKHEIKSHIISHRFISIHISFTNYSFNFSK